MNLESKLKKVFGQGNWNQASYSPRMAYDFGIRDGKGGRGTSLSITSDGFVVVGSTARATGAFMGKAEDFGRNLNLLLADAKLTAKQRKDFDQTYKVFVTDWRK